MSFRRRIALSLLVFISILVLRSHWGPSDSSLNGDFDKPLCAANQLLRGTDPYSCSGQYLGQESASYPLTTVFFVMPFLPFGEMAGLVIFAASSALMTFGLTRDGQIWRLLPLLSAPYWDAYWWLQWSPFFIGIALIPGLLVFSIVKPQLAMPLMLTQSKLRDWIGIVLFVALTLLIDSTWPLRWFPQTQGYDGYILLLVPFLGSFLLLTWLRPRRRSARLLFFLSLMPQRGLYDSLLVWLIPSTPRQMLVLTASSWLVKIIDSQFHPFPMFFLYMVLFFIYYPALAMVLTPFHFKPLSLPAWSVLHLPPRKHRIE